MDRRYYNGRKSVGENKDGFLLERLLLFDYLRFVAHVLGRAKRPEVWLESLKVRRHILCGAVLPLHHDPWHLVPSRSSASVCPQQRLQLKGEHDALYLLWSGFNHSAGLWLLGGTALIPIPCNCHWLRSHWGQGSRGVRALPGDESLLGEDLRL